MDAMGIRMGPGAMWAHCCWASEASPRWQAASRVRTRPDTEEGMGALAAPSWGLPSAAGFILQRQLDVGMALLWVHDPPFEGLEKALNPWFTSWEWK